MLRGISPKCQWAAYSSLGVECSLPLRIFLIHRTAGLVRSTPIFRARAAKSGSRPSSAARRKNNGIHSQYLATPLYFSRICSGFSALGVQIALHPARDEMNHRLTIGFQWPARALAFALALQLACVSAPAQSLPIALKILAVEGDGATGPVRQRPSQVPVIRVIDENEKPISGAAVIFTLPTEGATGEFPNGSKTLMVMTDERGNATAQGLRFNQIPGKVPITVNASYKGLTTRANIIQVSVAPAGYKPGGGSHAGKWIAIVAVVAAGGAAGAFLGLRNNGSTSSTPTTPVGPQPIGITAGSPTLAPPH